MTLPQNQSKQDTTGIKKPYFLRIYSFLKLQKPELLLLIIFLITITLYAFLMVWDKIPIIGLAILGLFWFLYWKLCGRFKLATPIDLPIILILSFLLVSFYISVDKSLTLPKIFGVILGIAFFYLIINTLRRFQLNYVIIPTLVIIACGISVLGIIGSDWSGSNFFLPSKILNYLSMRSDLIQKLTASGGIHVNTIGGVLTFFVPLLVSLLWDGGSYYDGLLESGHQPRIRQMWYRASVLLALFIVVAVVILTQSRGSILGCVIGVVALLIWRNNRFVILIPIILIALLVSIQVLSNGNINDFITLLDTGEDTTLQVRFEYWKSVILLIRDFPLTGTGLGTYGKIFNELYDFIPFAARGKDFFYAHNMYLAVVADLGIPGFIVYISLFSSIVPMVLDTIKSIKPDSRTLLIGLTCGFIAHLVYGVWDNFMLGEKLGIVMWIYLGLITAIFLQNDNQINSLWTQENTFIDNLTSRKNPQFWLRWLRNLTIGLGFWIFASIISVSFVNINIYASLIIALFSGVILGALLVKNHENQHFWFATWKGERNSH